MAYIGVSPSNGVRQKHTYTATASQTTFSGAGAEGVSLSYRDSNYVDVYVNGVKLGDADYTATSGTSIVLGEGAAVNDIIEIVTYDVFSVADTVSKADGGTFDGNVSFADNTKAIFGAGSDLQIYHDGSNSIIEENSGAGSLIIKGTNISFEDGTGAETYATFIKDGAVTLRYDNATKLATLTNGVDITGTLYADGIALGDNQYLQLGASQDLQIWHDGSNSFVKDAGTGSLRILGDELKFLNAGDNQLKLTADTNGAVKLYYSGTEKVATTATGVDVTGDVTSDTVTLDTGASDWQFSVVSNNLIISYGGVNKMKLDTSGNLTVVGDVTAFGSV